MDSEPESDVGAKFNSTLLDTLRGIQDTQLVTVILLKYLLAVPRNVDTPVKGDGSSSSPRQASSTPRAERKAAQLALPRKTIVSYIVAYNRALVLYPQLEVAKAIISIIFVDYDLYLKLIK